MRAEQWKTTIDLPRMNLIIFPTSACPTSLFKHNCGFPWFSLLVARLLQSAVIILVNLAMTQKNREIMQVGHSILKTSVRESHYVAVRNFHAHNTTMILLIVTTDM